MNNINQKAAAILEKRRSHHQLTQRKHQQHIYAEIPEIKALDEKISGAGIQFTRAMASKNPQAVADFKANIQALKAQKKALLLKAGYPEDYLSLRHTCALCQDKGYHDGHLCTCLKQERIKAAFSSFDLNHWAQNENFETFDADFYPDAEGPSPRKKMQRLKTVMEAYCADFSSQQDNFLFSGPPGTGKTFMSNCVANALITQGISVVYLTASHLISEIQSRRFNDNMPDHEIFAPFFGAELLIIDDFGAEHLSPYGKKQLSEVIDTRLLNNRRIILSSNLSIQEIFDTYDERLTSRIRGNFTHIQFVGDDIRLQKKQASRQ